MAKHNKIGEIGENVAAQFLKDKGLSIVERNYRKPYGEIDIVAREKNIIRFVEVKSVSCGTGKSVSHLPADLPAHNAQAGGSAQAGETIRPEENLHPQKARRLRRVIEAYVLSRLPADLPAHNAQAGGSAQAGGTEEWAIDLLCVYINETEHSARVKWIKDIILE